MLLCTDIVSAQQQQNVEFDKKHFPKDKEGLKNAQKHLELGSELYDRGFLSSKIAALPYLLYANDFNPNNAELNVMIGDCYLRSTDEKGLAIKYLEKAAMILSPMQGRAYELLGEAYHLTYEFDKAILHLNLCKKNLDTKAKTYAADLKRIDKRIAECVTGKDLIKTPVNVFIDNLGGVVNTADSEYGPIISVDGATLYFTSLRFKGEKTSFEQGASFDENDYVEDIYVTYLKNRKWSLPEALGSPINTSANNAVAGISSGGDILFVFLPENGGDLGYTTLNGDTWAPKKPLGSAINSPAHEASASLSPDGRTLYFVSNRNNPEGNHQIYYSSRDIDGAWTPAKPIGAPIASEYDERAVFMHTNGKTLYFSSNGHNTMGGYDIFRSDFENGQWTTPVNMGYPINTPEDDLFFMLSASGHYAYFSSFRKGGFGQHDLYRITFIEEKPLVNVSEDNLMAYMQKPLTEASVEKNMPELLPTATVAANATTAVTVTLLKGVVKDAKTHKPLFASIEITDNDLGKVISSFTTNSQTGSYMVALPSGKNYGLVVKAANYLFYSENVDIRKHTEYQEIYKDVTLNEIQVGAKTVLNNIFFGFGNAELSTASIIELKRMVVLLNDQPSLRIEISGHTDNIGTAEFNAMLSGMRAKAVVNYLVESGIAVDRLTSVGYGPDQPIGPNTTAQGRAANRRTEIKVLEN
jgi:outer membrane protein OmpA-like peptidoglycan-associated protein/tetratricopeptide (TPR) repeat protein